MNELLEVLQREAIYLWYYITIQIQQILPYWLLGMVMGTGISVLGKEKLNRCFRRLEDKRMGLLGIAPACALGIASPLCMYGTIPIAASFARTGMREDWLAAFMTASILLNPQLMIYSAALGYQALAVRILSCFLCGAGAGLLVYFFFGRGGKKSEGSGKEGFFRFSSFGEPENRDTDPSLLLRLFKNFGRNVKATGSWFLLGIFLAAAFQRYVPAEAFASLFGKNEGFGVLMAATIGVPLYACGGGTIPLLQQWLSAGMSLGSAAAFMITGPATKTTNLGAVKIVLGMKHFLLYLTFIMAFAWGTGVMVNWAAG